MTSTFVTNLNGRNGNCYNGKDQKMVVYEVLQSFHTTLVKKNNNMCYGTTLASKIEITTKFEIICSDDFDDDGDDDDDDA